MWQMDKHPVFDPQWIWNDRIPRRELTLLVPTPGGDATDVISDLVARVSAGVALPGDEESWGGPGPQPPQGVVLVTAGGDPRSGIARRIALAGGLPDQLLVITGVAEPSDDENALPERSLSLTTDLPALRREILDWNRSRQGSAAPQRMGLLVIDSLPFQVAKWREADLRTLFDQLNRLANELDLAVVLVTPLIGDPVRFAAGKITLPKALGSLAMVERARAIWQICPATDGPDRFLLLPLKSNSRAAPTAYQMRDETVVWDESSPSDPEAMVDGNSPGFVRERNGDSAAASPSPAPVSLHDTLPNATTPASKAPPPRRHPDLTRDASHFDWLSLASKNESSAANTHEREPATSSRAQSPVGTGSPCRDDANSSRGDSPAQRSADEIRQSPEWKRASRSERKRLLREAVTR